MIRGIFSLSGALTSDICSIVCSLSDTNNIHMPRKRKIDRIEDSIKHAICNDSFIGVLVADINERSIYVSHSNCKGSLCDCRQTTVEYLTSNRPLMVEDKRTKELKPDQKYAMDLFHDVGSPLLSIFSVGSLTFLLTKYSDFDGHLELMNNGHYFIRWTAYYRTVFCCSELQIAG